MNKCVKNIDNIIKKWMDDNFKLKKNIFIHPIDNTIHLSVSDVNITKEMFNLSFNELHPYLIEWLDGQAVKVSPSTLFILCS